jgi:hypothetical protein
MQVSHLKFSDKLVSFSTIVEAHDGLACVGVDDDKCIIFGTYFKHEACSNVASVGARFVGST